MIEKLDRAMAKKRDRAELIFNSVSHGIGVIFGVFVLIVLLTSALAKGDTTEIISFSIYGSCLILMFSASSIYHSVTAIKIKRILRVFDHASIFIFIAGTYTPIIALSLTGTFRLVILISIWIFALSGVIFKILTYGKFDQYEKISLVLYIGMGWIAVIATKAIINATGIDFFYWLLAGGILYTLGIIFYRSRKIPFSHGIWHLFVLLASIIHFIGIYRYLV